MPPLWVGMAKALPPSLSRVVFPCHYSSVSNVAIGYWYPGLVCLISMSIVLFSYHVVQTSNIFLSPDHDSVAIYYMVLLQTYPSHMVSHPLKMNGECSRS